MGWLIRCTSCRIWLTAPASNWNRNRKMKPVTRNGSSHGTMTRERASLFSGNLRLNSNARPKPMRNWKSRESTVNVKVRIIALCVTAWSSVNL